MTNRPNRHINLQARARTALSAPASSLTSLLLSALLDANGLSLYRSTRLHLVLLGRVVWAQLPFGERTHARPTQCCLPLSTESSDLPPVVIPFNLNLVRSSFLYSGRPSLAYAMPPPSFGAAFATAVNLVRPYCHILAFLGGVRTVQPIILHPVVLVPPLVILCHAMPFCCSARLGPLKTSCALRGSFGTSPLSPNRIGCSSPNLHKWSSIPCVLFLDPDHVGINASDVVQSIAFVNCFAADAPVRAFILLLMCPASFIIGPSPRPSHDASTVPQLGDSADDFAATAWVLI